MLAADGSTEVAEEQEDRRLLAPEIREADEAAVTRHERGVRSGLADGGPCFAIARKTTNRKRRHCEWPAGDARCPPRPHLPNADQDARRCHGNPFCGLLVVGPTLAWPYSS